MKKFLSSVLAGMIAGVGTSVTILAIWKLIDKWEDFKLRKIKMEPDDEE